MIRRYKHDDSLVQKSLNAVNWTFAYHGAPSGTVLADEKQHDLSPFMGSELCTAVETAYSLAYLYQALGTNLYADRAERTVFNALPVMLTGDKWAHQYMDQPNQPWGVNNTQDFGPGPHVFTTANTGMATTWGMEPVYPCCTVNHPQGYPKFLTHSWAKVGDSGLAHSLLSPSTVTTSIGGSKVTVKCDTLYPFANKLTYTINADGEFDLYLRVPDWYDSTSTIVSTSGASSSSVKPDSQTGMHSLRISHGSTTVTYTIGTKIRTEARANSTVSVFYGNVLYALDVGDTRTSSLPHSSGDAKGPGISGLPFAQLRDYYISNTSAWNVAIDPTTLSYHGIDDTSSLPTPVFEYGAAKNYISVQGCEIAWDLYLGATPSWVPKDRTCIGSPKEFRLIPYGTSKVHMSELPVVDLGSGAKSQGH